MPENIVPRRAPVVTSHARVPISMLRPETIEFLSSADDRIGLARFPGQLWERVAESELVPTGRYIRVERHARLERKRGNRS